MKDEKHKQGDYFAHLLSVDLNEFVYDTEKGFTEETR